MFKKILFLLLVVSFSNVSFAEDSIVDDAFDPFADYSDFVEATTEETDINFFKFGRMLSTGLIFGYRSHTGTLSSIYNNSSYFGANFTYYMSLQFAIQVVFHQGKHNYSFDSEVETNTPVSGSVTLQSLGLHGKYFINTQNLTKSISKYNPYIVGGFSQLSRSTSINGQPLTSGSDNAASFELGAGIEYLFNNNKNYVSLQVMYHKADFGNEGSEIQVIDINDDPTSTGVKPDGDPLTIQIGMGFNF